MMNPIAIRYPIWETRSVGVSLGSLPSSGDLYVEILYTRKKDGLRSYPHIYKIAVDKLRNYPVRTQRGVALVEIPINDMIIAERRDNLGGIEKKSYENYQDK